VPGLRAGGDRQVQQLLASDGGMSPDGELTEAELHEWVTLGASDSRMQHGDCRMYDTPVGP
jgi:hypothetical protein